MERTGYAMQPWILGFTAVMNMAGIVLVGLGTNMLTGSNSPPYANWILGTGILISILSAFCPIFLPFLIKYASEKQHANQK
jgi:hypothetical protein